MHILVVEDEKKIADAVCKGLEDESYSVTVSATGEDGYFQATTRAFDLILLDMGRGEIIILHQALGDQNGVFEITTFPGNERHYNILAQSQLPMISG